MNSRHGAISLTLLIFFSASCSGDDNNTSTVDMSPAADMTLDKSDMPTTQDMKEDVTADMREDAEPDMRVDTPDMREEVEHDMKPVEEDMAMPPTGDRPLAGFGEITGACDELDTELDSPAAHFIQNTLDFGMDAYDMGDKEKLSADAQAILDAGNAGGSSLISETFAFEILYRCEGAKLLATETEVMYHNPMGKITDLLVEIDGKKVGVSVVRAFVFPFDDPYPYSEAERILTKKLEGINESTANVKEEDRWVKQILSVAAYSEQHAVELRAAFDAASEELKTDTILYVTVMEGEDRPIFFNED